MSIDKIRPYPKNSNVHPQDQIRLLSKLLFGEEENTGHGWRLPITISNRSGFIVRGHGRFEAAQHKGLSHAPVDFQDYESDEMERADRLADNRINELSHFDRDLLRGELEYLDSGILDDIELTGFDSDAIEELFTAAPPPGEENNGINIPDEIPDIDIGDKDVSKKIVIFVNLDVVDDFKDKLKKLISKYEEGMIREVS